MAGQKGMADICGKPTAAGLRRGQAEGDNGTSRTSSASSCRLHQAVTYPAWPQASKRRCDCGTAGALARTRKHQTGIFFRNADLVELSVEARLLFIRLWTIRRPREGRLEIAEADQDGDIPADSFDINSLLSEACINRHAFALRSRGKRYLVDRHHSPPESAQRTSGRADTAARRVI